MMVRPVTKSRKRPGDVTFRTLPDLFKYQYGRRLSWTEEVSMALSGLGGFSDADTTENSPPHTRTAVRNNFNELNTANEQHGKYVFCHPFLYIKKVDTACDVCALHADNNSLLDYRSE